MTDVKWTIRAREFGNCNCSYGCPCQFNGLPTHGDCRAILAFEINSGNYGDVKLDGLKAASLFAWPGPVHKGHGESMFVIDSRADEAQRNALVRIMSGKDTEPGATHFNVFASMTETFHDPVFADIDFDVDIAKRRAHIRVAGQIEARGEPILNPVTGNEHRVRIDMPNGFEFRLAEIGCA